MSKSIATDPFVVQKVILSYPNVFAPRQVNNNGIPKFSVKAYLDQNAAMLVNQKMQELAAQLTGGETRNPKFRWPIQPTDGTDPRTAGMYVMNANADQEYPPQVVDEHRNPIMDRGKIYPGVIAALGIRLYSYNNMGNVGIGCGLIAVMKQGDGEPLVEKTDIDAMFADVEVLPSQGMQMPGGAPLPQNPQAIPNATGQPSWMQQAPQQPQQPQQPQAPQFPGMPNMPFPGR